MPDTPLKKTVPGDLAGRRLDQALAQMFPEYSRSRLKQWLTDGYITVDDDQPRPRDPVLGGECVVLSPADDEQPTAAPEPVDFGVAWEDDWLLVVDKPAGLVVHPGAGNAHGTLMNGLLHYLPGAGTLPRAGIVHRLDKETSGLLVVAKTLEVHTALVRLLADRQISRRYLAVCNGVPTAGGTIDEPIGRHPTDRLRMCVRDTGKPALTRYRVRERFRAHAALDVDLETGRTHQIRVHLAYRRYPLVGDPVYGGRLKIPASATPELADCLRRFRRQALHASRLSFRHPVTGKELSVESAVPADLDALLGALRIDAGVQA